MVLAVVEAALAQVGAELGHGVQQLPAAQVRQLELLEARGVDQPALAIRQDEGTTEGGGVAATGQCGGDLVGLLAGGGHQGVEQGGFAHAALAQQHGALADQAFLHGFQRGGVLQGRNGQHRVAQRLVDARACLHLLERMAQVLLGHQHQDRDVLGGEAEQQPHQQCFVEGGVAADQHGGLIDVGGNDLLPEGVAAAHLVATRRHALDGRRAALGLPIGHVVAHHAVQPSAHGHGGQVRSAIRWGQQELAAIGGHHVGLQSLGTGLAARLSLAAGRGLAGVGTTAARAGRLASPALVGQGHGLVLVAGTRVVVVGVVGGAGAARVIGGGHGCGEVMAVLGRQGPSRPAVAGSGRCAGAPAGGSRRTPNAADRA